MDSFHRSVYLRVLRDGFGVENVDRIYTDSYIVLRIRIRDEGYTNSDSFLSHYWRPLSEMAGYNG